MMITNQITMDLLQCGYVPVVEAVQNDRYCRALALTLVCGGESWAVPVDAAVVIRYRKADGKGGEYDTLPDGSAAWQAEGNVLTIVLAPQILTAAGPVEVMVALIREERQISTFAVLLNVHASVNENVGQSEEYTYVTRFLPGPEKAQAGEVFRITEVDGQGRVTKVEAVKLQDAFFGGDPGDGDIPRVFLEGQIPEDKEDVEAVLHYVSRTVRFDAYVKIKCQGSASMNYPKKNFTVKLYSDEGRERKLKKGFRDWGQESHKYVLKADYIDHSHARNIVSARLWDEIVASREDYDALPEQMKRSPRHGAVDGFPIRLYANGVCQGIYTWNIPKDGWMLCMDEENSGHCMVMGANNSFNGRPTPTSCQFRAEYNALDWETEFPDALSQAHIDSLNRVIDFVMTSADEEFKAGLDEYIDVQSAIDYRIFADVIAHHDGLGNNLILFTLDGVKWRLSAYDMDSTFGLWWDGTSYVSSRLVFPAGFQEPENLLFERLDAVFAEEIKARYGVLRETVLSLSNMVSLFEHFMEGIGTEAYEEDLEIYPGIPSGDTNNIRQIRSFIRERLGYCDGVMAGKDMDTGLIHSFEANTAAQAGWADSVDPSYRFDFTGEPNVADGAVRFSSGSYGVLNKEVAVADGDTTFSIKVKIATGGETWVLGTPNWVGGMILGCKNGYFGLDGSGENAGSPTEPGWLGVRSEGQSLAGSSEVRTLVLMEQNENYNVFTLKYVKVEQKLYCYANGVLAGAYAQSNVCNWLNHVVNLNNEGDAYRADNAVAFLKIWNRALSDEEILALNG